MMTDPTAQHIREASERIRRYIHRTPVFTSDTLNRMFETELFFKCENFQKAGVFKIRGATNAVFTLSDEEAARGVVTHSSGNHAAALALAARWRGVTAHVVMPRNAPRVKSDAATGYGAQITFCEPTLEAREETMGDIVRHTGAHVVHPYNDHRIIAGQGTAALELCEDITDLDIVIAPVGGGGLLSGSAIAVSSMSPHTDTYGAEPAGADDACRSFHAGYIIPSEHPVTIADGLLTSLGDLTFSVIRKYVKDILTVSEDAIMQAMRLIWERMKIVVEPSAAVPLGAALEHQTTFVEKRVGIILSGGNVDITNLPWNT